MAAALGALGMPTVATCSTISSAEIWAKLVNDTKYTVTISNVDWSGRYGTANGDGTISDRIEGTLEPNQSMRSRHRMGDPDIGERYTYLSFDATFTRANGSTGTCTFYYSYRSDTGAKAGDAASANGSVKDQPASCSLKYDSYYNITFDISDRYS
ncbi:hypothetical protein D9601_10775 [Sphingomonas sp. MA1305]|uniref:hypothetical protein n=1 Tax=Sphingomonas sp. MA1305 TaxID=2479204 RepID=UPI0018DF4A3A|nr:hypothetical protein [Sphingomonas sp. MA1305]MBI0475836.1 hypothetical protein [Sphingomonas sp. MA1305]